MRTLVDERMDLIGEVSSSLFLSDDTAPNITTGSACSFGFMKLLSSALELVYFWKNRLRLPPKIFCKTVEEHLRIVYGFKPHGKGF